MNPVTILKNPEFLSNFKYHAIVWTLAGIFFLLLRLGAPDEQSIYGQLSLINLLVLVLPMGLLAGLIFGGATTYVERFLLYKKSFRRLIIMSFIVYISGFLLFIIINYFRLSYLGNYAFSLGNFAIYITDTNSVIFIVYMLVVSFIFTMFRQIDRKMGRGILWRLVMGHYYEPKEVERTFMFMDLRSSTAIAEKLGNVKYSKFLQDCFSELSSIACYHAEIYQFVGDEVVLTWPVKPKSFKMDVLKTFLAFNEALRNKHDYFMAAYGVVPEFKAGIHSGPVTLAEVGQIKREMAYHGDTINTASRIQQECNHLKVDVLISSAAKSILTNNDYQTLRSLGLIKLRGREKEIEVFTI